MSNHQFFSHASVGPLQVLHGALPLVTLLLLWEGHELVLIIGKVANQIALLYFGTLPKELLANTLGKALFVQPTLSAAASGRRWHSSYVLH